VQKLVKISQFKNSDLLDNWYKKALNFERLRKKAIEEFRSNRKRVEVSLSKDRTTSILDIPRREPNTMEIAKCKESRKCYNCEETGHLTVRYSKPKKERVETRIVKKTREDFSQGRE